VVDVKQFLVAVADRHLGDVGDIADLALGYFLIGEQCGRIHCGGSEADRRFPACDARLLRAPKQRAGLPFDLVVQIEPGDEPRDVLLGVRGLDFQLELPDDIPVGPGHLHLVDPRDSGELIEAPWGPQLSGCRVQ